MKNGYLVGMIAGAIAGFVDNIVSVVAINLGYVIGVLEAFTANPWEISFLIAQFASHLALNVIWGMFLGIMFALVYDSIPGKGIKKGLIFSLLFYFLLAVVRSASFLQSYGETWSGILWAKAFIWTGFFASIVYGIVLGVLYRKPTK